MKASSLRRPKEVFLSHASRDRRFVQKLAAELKGNGVPFWFSQTHLKGAQQWHDEIGTALARCDLFILVASPNSTASMWVKRELSYALIQKRYEGRIIPLIHKPCSLDKLSWTLDSFQHVDFSSDFSSGMQSLLRVWGIK